MPSWPRSSSQGVVTSRLLRTFRYGRHLERNNRLQLVYLFREQQIVRGRGWLQQRSQDSPAYKCTREYAQESLDHLLESRLGKLATPVVNVSQHRHSIEETTCQHPTINHVVEVRTSRDQYHPVDLPLMTLALDSEISEVS